MVPASERHVFKFTDFFTDNELELLKASGEKLIDNVGIDVIRGVVYDVLTGRNLRDSTEVLTRRRITTVNLAIVRRFVNDLLVTAPQDRKPCF